jgi:S1-C subfamily serine protease
MALIPPFFLDAVVAIGDVVDGGRTQYIGTGFLYGRSLEEEDLPVRRYQLFLISNRHILQGKEAVKVRFNPEGDAPAREYEAPLVDEDGELLWSAHDDPEVDIAALPINSRLLQREGIRFSSFRDDENLADRERALEEGISEGDGIFVLGFPMGQVGNERNYVIVRQGAIARIRDALAGTSKEFLVDALIFPGNSGGPIVTRPEFMAIYGTRATSQALLLGIVASYVPYRDVAVSLQTERPRIIFEENSGLTSAFPTDMIQEVVEKAAASLDDRRGEHEPSLAQPLGNAAVDDESS